MVSSMISYHSYGIIPLVWYDSIGMVCFHLYGTIPFLWYDSIGMVCFSLYGIIPFLWYDSEHIWHKEILVVWKIGDPVCQQSTEGHINLCYGRKWLMHLLPICYYSISRVAPSQVNVSSVCSYCCYCYRLPCHPD